MRAEELFAPRVRIGSRDQAERLVADVTVTMEALEALLDTETTCLRAGKLREGLAAETRKGELAGAYLRGLEACKANAVALARFTPDSVESLKQAHAGFQRAVERNQVVVATARAVSESLVRGLADEMARATHPQTYGATRRMAPPALRPPPIICSKRM